MNALYILYIAMGIMLCYCIYRLADSRNHILVETFVVATIIIAWPIWVLVFVWMCVIEQRKTKMSLREAKDNMIRQWNRNK